MTEKQPTIEDLQALSQHELELLVAALVRADTGVEDVPTPFSFLLDGTGVYVWRAAPQRPALTGVVLPALARAARDAQLGHVLLVTSGLIDADTRPQLDLALAKLAAATTVEVKVLDGEDLLARVARNTAVRARFFPLPEEVEAIASAGDVPANLVKAATAIATREPESPLRRGIGPYIRLGWAVAVLAAVIAIPIPLSPSEARRVAIAGLGIVLLSLAISLLATRLFGPTLDRFGGVLLEQLLPLPDRMSLLRKINTGSPGTLMLLILIGFMALLRLLRLFLFSGVLGFIAVFGFGYLLLWSIEPTQCTSLTASCHGAFVSAGARPSVGDFFYLATQSAFFNQPAGLTVYSRAAHAMLAAEFLAAGVLLVGLAASIGLPNGIWSNLRAGRRDGRR